MGRVWRAHDLLLDRDVAVKEVLPVAGLPETREELTRRTVREARAAARLTHPHAIQVFDVPFAEGRPWIVMELVSGRSLETLVREDGPLGVAEVARIGLALLDVLEAAHRIGLLHRDVKPHNILMADNGRVMLGDFGVAGAVPGAVAASGGSGPPEEVIPRGVTLASPAYVAPERAADGSSTVETDLWSLGATLYWAVEGRPPYTRADVAQQLAALATELPDPVACAGPLAPLLHGLLQPVPHHRLTAAKARRMLASLAATDPAPTLGPEIRAQTGADRGRAAAAPAGRASVRSTPAARTRAPRASAARTRARRAPAVAVVVVILAAVVGIGGAVGAAAARPVSIGVFVSGSAPLLPVGCDSGDDAGIVPPAPGAGSVALPAGWIRTGNDRFSVGVPRTWQRTRSGELVCLRAQDPTRIITVERVPSGGPDHVGFWQREEQQMRQRGAPADYQRIGIRPVSYRDGGADWEYTYDNDRVHWHVLMRHFTAGDQTFVVTWTTTDTSWNAQQGTFTAIMNGFEAR
jgi:hypothetical protein